MTLHDTDSAPKNIQAITPADSDLAVPIRRVYCNGAGTLIITTTGGTTATITVPANFLFDCEIARIGGSSTATGIIGFSD